MEILGVLLHVLGKAVDSVGKNSNLNLGRTGISLIDFVLFNDSGLGFLGNHFVFTFLKKFLLYPGIVRVKSAGYARNYFPTERGHTQYCGIGQNALYHKKYKK